MKRGKKLGNMKRENEKLHSSDSSQVFACASGKERTFLEDHVRNERNLLEQPRQYDGKVKLNLSLRLTSTTP